MPLALSTGLALPHLINPANLAGNSANNGATVPLYATVREAAIYDASQDITVFAWEAWDGERQAHVSYYDHAAGRFGNIVDVGIPGLVDDDHGVPAIVKDDEGYWHLFGGAHITDIQHASTNSPNDLSAWTVRSALSGSDAYPHPVLVGEKIYLFNRESDFAADSGLKLRVTDTLAAGVATWGSEVFLVNLEGVDGDRVYAGNFIVVGTEIWFITCLGTVSDTERKHVYFFKYETTTGNIKNFAGTTTVLAANLPVDRTTADASFRIYEHTGTNKGNDVPVWIVDGSNNPYVFYAVGPLEGPYDIKMMRHNGVSWQAEENTGAGGIGRYFVFAPVRNSDGTIDLYYPDPNDQWPDNWSTLTTPLDGHINRVTRSAGGVWGASQRIITATDFPIGRTNPVKNADPDAQVIMAELNDGSADAIAGNQRIFIYGQSGFLGRPAGVQNITAPSITGTTNVGETLTANVGAWRAYPQATYSSPLTHPVTFTYQWFADGVEISGATGSVYSLTASELNKLITVRVTGSNGTDSLAVTSASVGPIGEQLLAYFAIQSAYYPEVPVISTPAFTNSVIDATGEKFAWMGRVWNKDRATKSVRKVHFLFGTVTKAGGSALTVSLQNVDTANGPPFRPDETQDQTVAIANADAGFVSNGWYTTGNLSADRSVAFGELLAVVVEYDGGGRLGADAVNFRNLNSTTPLHGSSGCSLLTASWAAVSVVPNIILEFSDGTFGTLDYAFPASNATFLSVNSGSTPDEVAIEFSAPAAVKIDGAWFAFVNPAAGADFDVVLYDSSTAIATVSQDANAIRLNGTAMFEVTFPEVTIAKDATYRLALKPTTTNNIFPYYFDVNAAAHKQAHQLGGTNWNHTSRTDAGAWAAPTTTRQIIGGLRLSAIQG